MLCRDLSIVIWQAGRLREVLFGKLFRVFASKEPISLSVLPYRISIWHVPHLALPYSLPNLPIAHSGLNPLNYYTPESWISESLTKFIDHKNFTGILRKTSFEKRGFFNCSFIFHNLRSCEYGAINYSTPKIFIRTPVRCRTVDLRIINNPPLQGLHLPYKI